MRSSTSLLSSTRPPPRSDSTNSSQYDAAHPLCDSPNTLRRFALGASNICLIGEGPTCSVPALLDERVYEYGHTITAVYDMSAPRPGYIALLVRQISDVMSWTDPHPSLSFQATIALVWPLLPPPASPPPPHRHRLSTVCVVCAACIICVAYDCSVPAPATTMTQAMFAANVCMWLGLVLITSIDVGTLLQRGAEPVLLYNPDTFILFLGAVVVCFEGIGLVLPLRDSMEPHMQVSFSVTPPDMEPTLQRRTCGRQQQQQYSRAAGVGGGRRLGELHAH